MGRPHPTQKGPEGESRPERRDKNSRPMIAAGSKSKGETAGRSGQTGRAVRAMGGEDQQDARRTLSIFQLAIEEHTGTALAMNLNNPPTPRRVSYCVGEPDGGPAFVGDFGEGELLRVSPVTYSSIDRLRLPD